LAKIPKTRYTVKVEINVPEVVGLANEICPAPEKLFKVFYSTVKQLGD